MSTFDYRLVQKTSVLVKKWDDSPGGAYDVVETGRLVHALDQWSGQSESFGNDLRKRTFTFYINGDHYTYGDEEAHYSLEFRVSGQEEWKYFSYANVEFKNYYDYED